MNIVHVQARVKQRSLNFSALWIPWLVFNEGAFGKSSKDAYLFFYIIYTYIDVHTNMLQNLCSTHFYNNVQLTLQQVMVHKKTRWQRWDRGVMRIWSLTPTTKILPAEISRAKNSPGPYAWKPGNQTAGFSSPFLYMDIYIYIFMVYWFVDTRPIFQKSWKSVGVLLVFDRSLFMI